MRNRVELRQPIVEPTSKQRRHRPDYQLILYVGILMMTGLIFMYTIGAQRANVLNATFSGVNYAEAYFFIKQLVSLIIALAALGCATFLPLALVRQHAGKVLLAGLVACGLLFLMGNVVHMESLVKCSYGACRWFELGPLGSFQPAELLKLGMLLFCARFISDAVRSGSLQSWQSTLTPIAMLIGCSSLLVIVFQKDLGTGVAMIAIVLMMLVAAGLNVRNTVLIFGGVALLGIAMIFLAPHRMARVTTFLKGDVAVHNDAEQTDGEYHIQQAKIALGTGGLYGVGIGNSIQATGYLPEAINDSVFAIMGETFGFLGLTLLIILFSMLLFRMLRIADRVADPWLRMLCIGAFGWMASHVVLNIASMTGVIPLTGITLPLLSFGGTSMIFIAIAIGLVFQISRYTSHHNVTMEGVAHENPRSGRWVGRTRNPGRSRP